MASLAFLCELFNHSNQQITMRYLGINQDDIDEVIDWLNCSMVSALTGYLLAIFMGGGGDLGHLRPLLLSVEYGAILHPL